MHTTLQKSEMIKRGNKKKTINVPCKMNQINKRRKRCRISFFFFIQPIINTKASMLVIKSNFLRVLFGEFEKAASEGIMKRRENRPILALRYPTVPVIHTDC